MTFYARQRASGKDQVAAAMSLPLFLRGLVVVLVVFAVVTYLITGSVWTTFVNTVICAVLVQVGYFAVVLFMVWKAPRSAELDRGVGRQEAAQGAPGEEQSATKVAGVPTSPTSPQH
jgi:exopolysaccharide production repressor protein